MTDKKTLIFNSVLNLIKENGFHSKIKISDIADKAGIGKGTVYGYFSNKEEIITESIIYLLTEKTKYVLSEDEDLSFEPRVKNLMKRILKVLKGNQNIYGVFMSQNIGSILSVEMKMRIKEEIEKIHKDFKNMIDELIERGKKENLFTNDIDDFNKMVIKPIIMSSTMEFVRSNGDNIDEDEFVNKLYNTIVKIL